MFLFYFNSQRIHLLIATFFISMMLSGCIVDNDKTVNLSQPKYKTTDASELFFKNVRAIYYEKEALSAAKLDVYRIKFYQTSKTKSIFELAIVMNWIKDEAYILLEPKPTLAEIKAITIKWIDEANKKRGIESFELKNKDDYFIFTSTIYDHILKSHKLSIVQASEEVSLFDNMKDKEAFRTTMYDFYNLVEIF